MIYYKLNNKLQQLVPHHIISTRSILKTTFRASLNTVVQLMGTYKRIQNDSCDNNHITISSKQLRRRGSDG